MKIYKTIKIPHLRHEIRFMDMSMMSGVEIKGSGFTAKQDENITIVFFEDIENTLKKVESAPYIAHELVHVLQILCEKIHSDIVDEQEHMAYIMHYIYSELLTK